MSKVCKRAMTRVCTVLLHKNTLALMTILCERFIPVSNEAVECQQFRSKYIYHVL